MVDPFRVEGVFLAAQEKRTPVERAAYLDDACRDEPELRQRVDELLAVRPGEDGNAINNTREHVGARSETIGSRIGPYKLLQRLGEGGMGVVYLAEQEHPVKRRVALKIIRTGMDSVQVAARFEQERQALAMMDHPNIAKVLDAGATEMGRAYFVMELVKGIPITRFCDQEHLTPQERLELFVPVCQAVQHAHQKGIIHRDLKPSNVLIALYDGKAVPKVIDFGVAKATHQKLTERTMFTEVGSIVGTLEYMAPEQAELNNLDIDTRADIYSLGVLLYELLTGSPPFSSKQLREVAFTEMLRMIREVEPHKPSTRLSSSDELPVIAANRKLEPRRLTSLLTGELDWIVMKALEKDRGRRYETANGLAMDIGRYLADEPVLASPPSAAYWLKKFVRRNKGPVAAAAAISLAIVAGVAAVLAVQARSNHELAGKNDELAAKNAELADEQAKVQSRFELAQKSIATFHTGVSEDMLLKNDQFKELRTKLLKEAAGFYGELEKLLEGQTDNRSRNALAAGYFQLAELTEKIDSQPEALAVHRKALAVRRALAAMARADVETRLEVAHSLRKVGRLLEATGDNEGALAAYEEARGLAKHLESEAPTDAVRSDLANTHHNIGILLWKTEKPVEAMAEYEKARDIQQELADANPVVPEFQSELAHTRHNMAYALSQTGEPVEAMAEYEKTREIRQKLADANPAVARFRSDLAWTHNSIGNLLSRTGKPAEALASYQKALDIRQKLADANAAVTSFQQELAYSYDGIGTLLSQTGKPAEALAPYQKALDIRQKLVDANAAVTSFQQELASSHHAIGNLLSQTGKPAEALASYQKALDIRQKLADAGPTVTSFQQDLANNYHAIGNLLSQTGKPAEALAAYQKALDIRQKLADADPANIGFQRDLGSGLPGLGAMQLRVGQPAEAVASYRLAIHLLEHLHSPAPGDIYNLACSQALLAAAASGSGSGVSDTERQATTEQAMKTLRRAVAAGYEDLANMRTDTDLDALRQRDDFKKLMKDLQAKSEAKGP